ncbi:MAG: CDP-alcohol phosphatidyltransferase family protein [Thermosynechococcaceae cyanobacterium]
MPTLYQYKPAFQNRLRPLVRGLAQQGISPNQVTIATLALSGIMGTTICIFPQSPVVLLTLPVVLSVRIALNAMDGLLAREYGQTTPLGAILNEIGDVFSDIALYLPLSLVPGISAPAIAVIAVLALSTELTGVLGWAIARTRRYDGPMGKPHTGRPWAMRLRFWELTRHRFVQK